MSEPNTSYGIFRELLACMCSIRRFQKTCPVSSWYPNRAVTLSNTENSHHITNYTIAKSASPIKIFLSTLLLSPYSLLWSKLLYMAKNITCWSVFSFELLFGLLVVYGFHSHIAGVSPQMIVWGSCNGLLWLWLWLLKSTVYKTDIFRLVANITITKNCSKVWASIVLIGKLFQSRIDVG